MNEITNVTNEAAADIAAQLANGSAELVEVKDSNLKSNLIKAGVLLLTAGGSFGLGFGLGKLNERKKWESYEDDCDDEDEDFEEYEEFEDDEDYKEEPTDTKEAEKTDKPEEK